MDRKGMVEAALFSAGRPVSLSEIARASGMEEGETRRVLRALRKAYRMRATALEIVKLGAKFSLQLKEEYLPHTEQIARKELDRNTLKVAALIAYYQPMTKKDLVEMAGPKAWEHAELLQKAG
ncbi:MAG: SMC-Scp complex subunit ScpB, partial [Candidatus Thermoplasmatota archaeon]